MVLLLDAYSLGDPLFASALARDVHARGAGLVLVHGSAEAGERALEDLGAQPHAEAGVWQVASGAEAAAVERAARGLNRQLVHEINEAGASVVGVTGAGRGLLRARDGRVVAGRTEALAALVGAGASVVVASLVEAGSDGGRSGGALGAPLREADPAASAAALAGALGTCVAVLLTGRAPHLGPTPGDALSLDAARATGRLADAGAVARVAALGVPVRALVAASLRAPGLPAGTWIGAPSDSST